MKTNTRSLSAARAANLKIIAAVAKHFPKGKVLYTGTSLTPATLTELLQAENDANEAIGQSRAQLKEQVASALPTRTQALAARNGLTEFVLASFGSNAAQVLDDFGFAPKKRGGPQTAAARAQAGAKAAATRKARAAALAALENGASASLATQAPPPARVVPAAAPAPVNPPAVAGTAS
jgi:hypothetical protein